MTDTKTLREAATMALEALETLMAWQVLNVNKWHNSAYDDAAKMVEILRASLAVLDEPVAWYEHHPSLDAWFLAYSKNPNKHIRSRPLVFGDAEPRQPATVERKPLILTDLNEMAKRYCTNYSSPHHIAFTVEGLRNLIEAIGIQGAA